MNIGPCRYPRCRDQDGNPRLTSLGMCEGCQKHFRLTLGRLVMDWTELTTRFPTPKPMDGARRSTHKDYGHPAEWASDKSRRIADILNSWHDTLAEELGDRPAPHPGITDRVRVRCAWRYLECRVDKLAAAEFSGDAAQEISELHRDVRGKLGYSRPRQLLPVPCPRCELKTLTRMVDRGIDQIQCESCNYTTDQKHYGLLAAMILDAVLAEREEVA